MKIRRTIHQYHQLDDPHDLVQVARGFVKCAHQLNGDVSCRFLALSGGELGAELSCPGFAFLLGDVSRHKNQIARAHKRQERRRRAVGLAPETIPRAFSLS